MQVYLYHPIFRSLIERIYVNVCESAFQPHFFLIFICLHCFSCFYLQQ